MPWLIGGATSAIGASITGNNAQAQLENGQPNTVDVLGALNQAGYNGGVQTTNTANGAQQNYLNALTAQNGIGNQSSTYGQDQALTSQLQAAANGQGPNPALAQLNQTTGQNIASQASLMAGQRGAGANAGLLARQAGMQGAATQQQAVGQGATLAAQQQIAARQQLGGQLANQGNLATTQVGQQAGAIQGLNNMGVQQQQLADQIVGQQIGQQQSNNQIKAGIASQAANMTTATGNQVTNGISNSLGSGLMGGDSSGGGNSITSGLSGLSGILAYGGEVKNYAAGGSVKGPRSKIGKYFANFAGGGTAGQADAIPSPAPGQLNFNGQYQAGVGDAPALSNSSPSTSTISTQNKGSGGSGTSMLGGDDDSAGKSAGGGGGIMPLLALMARGGKVKTGTVPAMVSPGEIYLTPEEAQKVMQGRMSPMDGERIKGKAKVKGDSYANDTVPKNLEVGGVVIKRSKAKDPKEAAAFVAAAKGKSGLRR